VTAEHYTVLGAARPRAPWFAEVGRWSTTAALPVEFVRCVSTSELRSRLASGRAWSAVLLDEGCSGLDRDLLDEARRVGAAPIVVAGPAARRDWRDLGAVAVLAEPVERHALHAVLREHAPTVGTGPADVLSLVDDAPEPWSGQLVSVVGSGGTGTSTIATAVAQGLGADPARSGRVALVDACLDADLALLHDTGDVVPGLQELVELHRTGRADADQLRSMLWELPGRGYDLLAGLRRHRDWTVLRPRALESAVASLRRSYAVVVADTDPDLEGEDETGSPDVEDRNACARLLTSTADVVVVVGTDGVPGLHRMVRLLADLLDHGVPDDRLLPVLNRAPRSPRRRSEAAQAAARLLGELVPGAAVASPLPVPLRRELPALQLDAAALPATLCASLAAAVDAVAERAGPGPEPATGPVPVRPGSLGTGAAT
jgi:MinD-like ATPase involved in chromosome partitioning or flagellar assembly